MSGGQGDRVRPGVGRLYGVGLGPGDPELVTVKAVRVVGAADVVAYHSARHGRSVARSLAERYLPAGCVEEALVYPVTTERTTHPGGYDGALADFYADCARRLARHLDAGRTVVVLAEGDPLFYGSYMHLHKRLAHRYPTEVVPGVTSVSGAAAALGRPLAEHDEVLTVLPGTLPPAELARRLAGTDTAAVLKLGRTFPGVRDALERAGRLGEAVYVERATSAGQRSAPLADVDPQTVPYFSLALLPSRATAPGGTGATPASLTSGPGGVVVVGLGPGPREWLTPEAQDALACADHLVGYGPYLARVPPNPRQQRHASDNRVEAERARHALDLALGGAAVAVVSSGDPGVFAMAAAVLEEASAERYRDVPVRVVPGLTAAQALASRVGAPLGHDFCVLSLSDVLKPWDVVVRRVAAVAAADLVLAIYNPRSRSRPWQLGAALAVVAEHRDADTVVVVGRDVGGPGEQVTVTTLGALDPGSVDMRCTVLVGSSQTTARPGSGRPWTVLTPRRYPAATPAG